eukprot:tig00020723_g13422.t1
MIRRGSWLVSRVAPRKAVSSLVQLQHASGPALPRPASASRSLQLQQGAAPAAELSHSLPTKAFAGSGSLRPACARQHTRALSATPAQPPSGGHVVEVRSVRELDAAVLRDSHSFPVAVDVYADWCGPCKRLTPLLEKHVTAHAGAPIRLAKLNIDNSQLAGALQELELDVSSPEHFVRMWLSLAEAGALARAAEAAVERHVQYVRAELHQTAAALRGEVAGLRWLLQRGYNKDCQDGSAAPLLPVSNAAGEAPPVAVRSRGDFERLTGPQLDALLAHYALPAGGSEAEKRRRLRVHCGYAFV